VVTVDTEGNPVYLNQATYKAHEPSKETGEPEFAVQNIALGYSPEAYRFRQEVVVPTALRQGFWQGETRMLTRQGVEIPVWQTMVAHRDRNGELKLLTSIIRDLREQKASETRLRASCAAIAQQLRAPLQAIEQEASRILAGFSGELPPEAIPLLQELAAAVSRTRTLVEGLPQGQ
jgi:PAS domain-containing protein